MHPAVVAGCIAAIAVGVAIIMYTILRTPKAPASFGDRPSIDLGDEVPDEPIEEEGEKDPAEEEAEAEKEEE